MSRFRLAILFLTTAAIFCGVHSMREYSKQDLQQLKEEVKEVFYHAYNGYLNYAFPYDELRPLSCDGVDTWGSYSLTLIDALDTLAIMENYTEFGRVVQIITERANFDSNINVSVFETNIRIVGGLLSAHLLSEKAGLELEPGWPCNGPLLRLAEDVAKRLLPAFDTDTGMPFGTVNLKYGVPVGETSITCTAGVGTFIIEFGTLSRLTGDPIYEEVAMNALRALFKRKSFIGLFGNHIDTRTGVWTAQDSGIGAGVDSYFEYLVKGAILFQKPELMKMFNEVRPPIEKYLKRDDWYMWVSMHKGQVTLPVFQSLEAFWPGILSLIGDVRSGLKSLHNYHQVWKQYGFVPEFYNIVNSEAGANRESYPLRPELIESVMYLYRATEDPYLLDVGVDMLRSIQHSAKTPCGYATIKNVIDHLQEDRMESFFLSETTKYLYLLFDTDNFIHNDGNSGTIFQTSAGKLCVLGAGGFIFNTEAHPIDLSALHCCSNEQIGDIKTFEEIKNEKENSQMNDDSEDVTIENMPNTIETDENSIQVDVDSKENTIVESLLEVIEKKSRFKQTSLDSLSKITEKFEDITKDNSKITDTMDETARYIKKPNTDFSTEKDTKENSHILNENLKETVRKSEGINNLSDDTFNDGNEILQNLKQLNITFDDENIYKQVKTIVHTMQTNLNRDLIKMKEDLISGKLNDNEILEKFQKKIKDVKEEQKKIDLVNKYLNYAKLQEIEKFENVKKIIENSTRSEKTERYEISENSEDSKNNVETEIVNDETIGQTQISQNDENLVKSVEIDEPISELGNENSMFGDNNENESVNRDDIHTDKISVNSNLISEAPPTREIFNAQKLFEKMSSNKLAEMVNVSFSILSCPPQPFQTKFTFRGEFFEDTP